MLLRNDGANVKRTSLTCANCGRTLPDPRTRVSRHRAGRIQKYCNDKCRDEARRARDFEARFGGISSNFVGVKTSDLPEIAWTHEIGSNSSDKSTTCEGEKVDRGSPVGADRRCPETGLRFVPYAGRIARIMTRAEYNLRLEIIARIVDPKGLQPPAYGFVPTPIKWAPLKWRPVGTIDPSSPDFPDLPAFLDRRKVP
jgi:hypothetical protein